MTRPLLAFSNVIIDRIRDGDGHEHPPMAGGAGLYAAVAMAMWWPVAALVAGVGEDFAGVTGGVADTYGLDNRGLMVRDARSIESRLIYLPDGTRTETPTFGPEHFTRMQVHPRDIDPTLLPAAGSYIFQDSAPEYWDYVADNKPAFGAVHWEIDSALAQRGDVAGITRVAPHIDLLSLNLSEAIALFGHHPPQALAEHLLKLGVPAVALRMGQDGALIATKDKALHIVPPAHPVVDVTGGGNAFSGGLLAGMALYPDDLAQAGRVAAASAACVIAQRGVPALPDRDLLNLLVSKTAVHSI